MNIYVYYYCNYKGCTILSLDAVLSTEAMLDRLEYPGELEIISPFQT